MALVSILPVAATVTWDAGVATPVRVRYGARQVRVVRVEAVRDERAAYPAGTTPRLTVVVVVESGECLELVFDARRRRWFVGARDAAA